MYYFLQKKRKTFNDTRVLLQGGSKMHYPLLLKAVHTNSNHRSIKDIMYIGGERK